MGGRQKQFASASAKQDVARVLLDAPGRAAARRRSRRWRCPDGQATVVTKTTSFSSPFQITLKKESYGNFKIFPHESCSKLKNLQLSFLDQLQIPISFESRILNLGILKSN
jgi:hypothetical protein